MGLTNSLCEGALHAPSAMESHIQDALWNAEKSGPLDSRFRFTSPFKNDRVAFVERLYFAGSPSAIAWLVVSFIVNAINRVLFRRALAHVGNKVRNICPAIANPDPSPAIAMEGFDVFVCASLHHRHPRIPRQGIGVAMLSGVPRMQFAGLASTARHFARRDICFSADDCLAARTGKPPFAINMKRLNGGQIAKFTSNEVGSHRGNFTSVVKF